MPLPSAAESEKGQATGAMRVCHWKLDALPKSELSSFLTLNVLVADSVKDIQADTSLFGTAGLIRVSKKIGAAEKA